MDEEVDNPSVINLGDKFIGVMQDPAKMMRSLIKNNSLKHALVIYENEDGEFNWECSNTDRHYALSMLNVISTEIALDFLGRLEET